MTEEQIRADEREKIAKYLVEHADLIPCQEDAMVMRSCAKLIRARFSYDEAERLDQTEST